LDKDGVWRDPMPFDAMTPKQRRRYVKMLREDSDTMGPRGDLQRAREQVDEVVARAKEGAAGEGGRPAEDPDKSA
jgi:hypothetical protein